MTRLIRLIKTLNEILRYIRYTRDFKNKIYTRQLWRQAVVAYLSSEEIFSVNTQCLRNFLYTWKFHGYLTASS